MELNEFAVEDCQAVQSLYASALSKDSATYEDVCKDLMRQSGGKDYFNARTECIDQNKAREAAQRYQRDSNEEVLLDNFNLFVVAARKAKIPDDMLEATMSIAGTLIVRNGKRTFKDSLVSDADTFNAHIKGGEASIYRCVSISCLAIQTINNHKISREASYQGIANTKLSALKVKMLGNGGFSEADKDFLSSIGESFPIYNYLSLEVVSGLSILDKSSDLVATYMILHYLGKVIIEVRQAIQLLEGKQINDQHFKDYLSHLDRVQDILSDKHRELMERAHQTEKRALYIENHHLAKIR